MKPKVLYIALDEIANMAYAGKSDMSLGSAFAEDIMVKIVGIIYNLLQLKRTKQYYW